MMAPNEDEIYVCRCEEVTVGDIKRAIKAKKTIKWYLDNKEWWETIISGEYQNYYEKMYANRSAKPLRRCELLGVISLLSPG